MQPREPYAGGLQRCMSYDATRAHEKALLRLGVIGNA